MPDKDKSILSKSNSKGILGIVQYLKERFNLTSGNEIPKPGEFVFPEVRFLFNHRDERIFVKDFIAAVKADYLSLGKVFLDFDAAEAYLTNPNNINDAIINNNMDECLIEKLDFFENEGLLEFVDSKKKKFFIKPRAWVNSPASSTNSILANQDRAFHYGTEYLELDL